jgi:hypothetical protein
MSEPLIERTANKSSPGVVSTIFGGLALAAVVWGWLLTFVIDPPNWIRIVGVSLLPIGIVVGLGAGLAGLRRPAARPWALAGLTLVVVAVVAHAALVFSVESVPPNRSTRGC